MAGLSRRAGSVLAVVGCGLVAVVVAVALVSHQRSAGAPQNTLRVLQLNLCDSGIAGCYTGKSVARAAAIIAAARPDVVTLNEVCQNDVSTLDRTVSTIFGSDTVVSAFRAAVDRRSGSAVPCRNGNAYGIGVIGRIGSSAGTYGGEYPMQGGSDVENRVWLCVHADVYACTTHLDSAGPTVAYAQCEYLLRTAIPAMRSAHGAGPIVLGGDLNLENGGTPDPRDCFPTSYAHADDGGRQHVAASGYRVLSSRVIDMHGTTDHPGLLVDLGSQGIRSTPSR